jgi:hypothetical protein
MKLYDEYDTTKVKALPGWSDKLEDDGEVLTLESSFDLEKIRRLFPSLTLERLKTEVKKKLSSRGLEEGTDYSLKVV